MKRVVLGTLVAAMAALGLMAAAVPAFADSGPCCVQHLHFEAGPYLVRPGANATLVDFTHVPKPSVDGYMIAMKPNLHYALGSGSHMHCCGAIPRVDVIHLHHGVWLSNGRLGMGEGEGAAYTAGQFYPFMASGEEKTQFIFPKGYGYPVQTSDFWVFNYMIHNLWPQAAYVYVTYNIDYVPMTSPLAKTIIPVHPIWMDVMDDHIYPVFNVYKGSGKNGKFTFPYMAKNPYPTPGRPLNEFVVDHPGTLIATAGHVHPGGLYTQLDDTRAGVKPHGGALPGLTPGSVRLFRSNAHYWDPRGPISWDMAMGVTNKDWRPRMKAGDVLSVSATYETRRASWYESMGIMIAWEAWDNAPGSVDPFSHRVDQGSHLTHGHLAENDNHGGTDWVGVNFKTMPSCDPSKVQIQNFNYNPGGFYSSGKNRCIPTIKAGTSLTFVNDDAYNWGGGWNLLSPNPLYVKSIFHTVTDCQAPCGLNTGISYPLANGPVTFDSAQLGFGIPGSNRLSWSTPKGLKPGIYTYFCRIHPFMRGVFRIVR